MPFFITPPLAIKDKPADKQHTSGSRSVSAIERIVLHDTGSKFNEDWEDTLYWLTTNPNSDVSAHRFIHYDGTIYKCASDTIICNHVGFSRIGNTIGLNRSTLGIELFRRAGDVAWPHTQIVSCVNQCVEWYGLHGTLPIDYHKTVDTQGKVDPRVFPRKLFDTLFFAALKKYL